MTAADPESVWRDFVALSKVPTSGQSGLDWVACVSADEWREHQERLQSVIDAQDFAAVTVPQSPTHPDPKNEDV